MYEGIPVWDAMDDLGHSIKVGQRDCGLRFVRRQEVGSKILEGFEELKQWLADAVVGVVGRGAVAERECVLEGGFILLEHRQCGFDAGPRSFGDDFVGDDRVLVADVL